ncbi:MAG TPA: hypothetical protein VFW16_01175 [Streptosporangiaceae bacterium]|nr:hypothetical protein [Streptosporangiaceae bacterium]
MNDYRAAGQELQGQVLAAARKGQQRVATTVKNVTAVAQQIRPQLASLPKPTLNLSALPGQAQLREKAPALVAKLPVRLQTKLPTPDQLKAGAEGLVGHALTVQRHVVDQVRTAAAPLAHQAAARLSQFGEPGAKPAPAVKPETTTKVSEVTVTRSDKATDGAGKAEKPKGGGTSTTKTRQTSTSRKPRTKQADK